MRPMRMIFAAVALAALCRPAAVAHPGSGIAVDPAGHVFFTDTGQGVWRIDRDGALTLVNPSAMHWMALDRAGGFADAPEQFGEWFGRLTPRGQKPALVSCSDFPCVVGADGNLYYAKMHGLTLVRRTPAGGESVLVTREAFGVGAGRPVGVNGLACGADGTLYLVSLDSLNKTVGSGVHVLYAVRPDGSVRSIAKNFVTEALPEAQRHPEVRPQYSRGMAVDGKGNVYVAVTGSRCVMRVAPSGAAAVVLRAGKPWSPTGVDVSDDGEVYVLEYDDETPVRGRDWPPRVRKVARDGKVLTLATVTQDAGPATSPAGR